jgi:ribosomal protein S6
MSRKYQGLIILNTKSLEGSVDDLVSAVSKEIETEGAKVEKISQLGRRQFAYASRHLEAGHYVNFFFNGTPEIIKKIQGRLRLNDHVHLQYFQRLA